MIRIDKIILSPGAPEDELRARAAALLGIGRGELTAFEIVRKSVDARKKHGVRLVYSVAVSCSDERKIVEKAKGPEIYPAQPRLYRFPYSGRAPEVRPVIAGAGPAGLFCALVLARAGVRCILLERGKAVENRVRDVEGFWQAGRLDPESNVQFGEGGAGAFSDGKLTTGTNDPRHGYILKELVAAGAPPEIIYLAKPHVGTDRLRAVVRNIRQTLISLGCDVRFESRLDGLIIENSRLAGVHVAGAGGEYDIRTDALVLAPGNSARDTFEMLHWTGVEMRPKNFAVGVRIEHRQADIDRSQYGALAGHPGLPVSDYKLACHLENGRSAFSFCVCPGGYVVAAASEPGHLVTNGMSEYARDGGNINGGLLVEVGPSDFGNGHPLAGMHYQAELERAAFELGGGRYLAPAQRVGDFLEGRPSGAMGTIRPTYRPGVAPTELSRCLPPYVADTIREALPVFDGKIEGFAHPDAVLTAVETRSSSPVTVVRGEDFRSSLPGLYPCGEGAGRAGGIMSAAADGIRCAEAVYPALFKTEN